MADGKVVYDITGNVSGFNKAQDEVKAKAEETAKKISSEMQKVNTQYEQNRTKIEGSEKALDSLNRATQHYGDSAKQVSEVAVGAARRIGEAFVETAAKIGRTIVSAAKLGIEYNAQMESYTVAIANFVGDNEKAAQVVEQIKESAKSSPFDTSELVRANMLLMSTGVEAEESQKMILALGDSIAATGGGNDELIRMAQNLQQIKNIGKASAVDIRQFGMAGVNIYGILAEQLGVSVEKVKEMDITYEQLYEAFVKASGEGGQYFGAMATQAATFNGQMSKLKANVSEGLGTAFKGLFELLNTEIMPKVLKFVEGVDFEKVSKDIVNLVQFLIDNEAIIIAVLSAFATLAVLLGMSTIISKVKEAFVGLFAVLGANPFFLVIALIAGLIAYLVALYKTNEEFRAKVDEIWGKVKEIFTNAIDSIKGKIDSVREFFSQSIPDMIEDVANWFSEMPGKINQWLDETINRVTSFASNLWDKAVEAAAGFVSRLINGVKDLPSNFKYIGRNIVDGIWSGISSGWEWLTSKISSLAKSLLNAAKRALGISSPSKVFRDEVGKFIPAGVSTGVEAETPEAVKAVEQMTSDVERAAVGFDIENSISHRMNFTQPKPLSEKLLVALQDGSVSVPVSTVVTLDGKVIAESVNTVNRKLSLQYGGYNANDSQWI